MEPIMLLILSISLIGIFMIFGLSHFKIENNILGQFNQGGQDTSSFMAKVKGNASKIRR